MQCRARGLNPAGGKEALADRLKEHMVATGDYTMKSETGEAIVPVDSSAGVSTGDLTAGSAQNNYHRAAGQNVGNFMTDRPSSRVCAPPGGQSQIIFGDESASTNYHNNNYSRPAGQNVGNFLTDKPSSRVAAPPGGASTIQFG